MKRIIPFALLLFCSVLIAAETTGYRIVHPDGTVEFTDDATRGGEEIKLRDVQTVSEPDNEGEDSRRKSESADKGKPQTQEEATTSYTGLAIVKPKSAETVWFTESGVTVTVSVQPKLNPKDSVTLTLDGTVVAQGNKTIFNIGQVYRGTHTLSASITGPNGQTLIHSSSVTFYLRQHSN